MGKKKAGYSGGLVSFPSLVSGYASRRNDKLDDADACEKALAMLKEPLNAERDAAKLSTHLGEYPSRDENTQTR